MNGRRIYSVDLLRGLTIAAMILVNNPGSWSAVYAPLLHAEWHGYTPTDLVFPFFLFIVGCSIAFAYRGKKPGAGVYRKIIVRSGKLTALGLFLGAFTIYPPFVKAWENIRLPGVLQRIGLVFLIAAPLALHLRSRQLVIITATLLLGYWAWLGYMPLPDGDAPTYARDANNWAMYVDKWILGVHTWKPDYDPEGLVSTLPAVATCLIGVVVGRSLLSPALRHSRTLLGAGAGAVVMGTLWSYAFPINKALWTSSFVLVTAGWAMICLGIIHYITDEKGKVFGRLFAHAGANALILFFLSSFIAKILYSVRVGEGSLYGWLYQTFYTYSFLPGKLSSLLFALSWVAIYLALGEWLYRRGVFFKV